MQCALMNGLCASRSGLALHQDAKLPKINIQKIAVLTIPSSAWYLDSVGLSGFPLQSRQRPRARSEPINLQAKVLQHRQ